MTRHLRTTAGVCRVADRARLGRRIRRPRFAAERQGRGGPVTAKHTWLGWVETAIVLAALVFLAVLVALWWTR